MIGPLATALGDVDTTLEEGRAFYQSRLAQLALIVTIALVAYEIVTMAGYVSTGLMHGVGISALHRFS